MGERRPVLRQENAWRGIEATWAVQQNYCIALRIKVISLYSQFPTERGLIQAVNRVVEQSLYSDNKDVIQRLLPS